MFISVHFKDESPSQSVLNRLGIYLLTSLLLVFGTMVEFSVVLLIKQKFDWDEKAMKKDTKQFLSNGKRGEKNLRIGSKIQVIEDMEKEDNVDY